MKYFLVTSLLCASLELTPSLSQVGNNDSSNLQIENNTNIEVTVPCISVMDESCSLPDGYTLPDLEELTPSIPDEKEDPMPTVSSSVADEEETLTEEEFFQIQEQNFIDRSIETDVEKEYDYNHYIYPLAKIIFAEASTCDDTHQRYVGYVVMNRVKSIYYPNTIEDVFFDDDSYAESSRERYNNDCVSDRAIKNAEIVIQEYFSDSIPVSPAMVYQAEFQQGVNRIKMGNTWFGCDIRIIEDLNSVTSEDPELERDTNK